MSTPAILYIHPRLRGALTEVQADAADYLMRRIGNRAVTLSMPRRIAENSVFSIEAIPAWMVSYSLVGRAQ